MKGLEVEFFQMAGLWLQYRGLQLDTIPQSSYPAYHPVFAMVGELDVWSEMFLIARQWKGELCQLLKSAPTQVSAEP